MEDEIGEKDRTNSKNLDPLVPFEIADASFCNTDEVFVSRVPFTFQVFLCLSLIYVSLSYSAQKACRELAMMEEFLGAARETMGKCGHILSNIKY
jgi:hypothetical protein